MPNVKPVFLNELSRQSQKCQTFSSSNLFACSIGYVKTFIRHTVSPIPKLFSDFYHICNDIDAYGKWLVSRWHNYSLLPCILLNHCHNTLNDRKVFYSAQKKTNTFVNMLLHWHNAHGLIFLELNISIIAHHMGIEI